MHIICFLTLEVDSKLSCHSEVAQRPKNLLHDERDSPRHLRPGQVPVAKNAPSHRPEAVSPLDGESDMSNVMKGNHVT